MNHLGVLSVVLSVLLAACSTTPEPIQPLAEDEGVVTLSCGLQPDGQVHDCQLLSETPVGKGFGQAAINAAHNARLSATQVERVRVTFTVRFRMSSDEVVLEP